MKRAFIVAVVFFAAALAGCGRNHRPWHSTDISGAMPDLAFAMTRANDGKPVTARDYKGRVVLLYFGYTHCPDVCPLTLANLADMLEKLGPDKSHVRVLFVTVDPNRDTLPVLKQYVNAFAPQMDGLRGTANAVAVLARRYRVAFKVTPGPPYTVTHTSAVFIFDAKGRARLVTLSTDDTNALADDVKRLVEE